MIQSHAGFFHSISNWEAHSHCRIVVIYFCAIWQTTCKSNSKWLSSRHYNIGNIDEYFHRIPTRSFTFIQQLCRFSKIYVVAFVYCVRRRVQIRKFDGNTQLEQPVYRIDIFRIGRRLMHYGNYYLRTYKIIHVIWNDEIYIYCRRGIYIYRRTAYYLRRITNLNKWYHRRSFWIKIANNNHTYTHTRDGKRRSGEFELSTKTNFRTKKSFTIARRLHWIRMVD